MYNLPEIIENSKKITELTGAVIPDFRRDKGIYRTGKYEPTSLRILCPFMISLDFFSLPRLSRD